ncbi:hypothetical protein HK100_004605 [Physocladia obscura]|uniref:Uncharacterized protein n=1 Tax=Physocladia obscura TaxID=109957 RepID=A0AAD5SSQ3_9FUNG|nr:hypothetical protein HK100_004605 [Physocladia obscura]
MPTTRAFLILLVSIFSCVNSVSLPMQVVVFGNETPSAIAATVGFYDSVGEWSDWYVVFSIGKDVNLNCHKMLLKGFIETRKDFSADQ